MDTDELSLSTDRVYVAVRPTTDELRPGQAANQTLIRHLGNSTAEQRQADREALLGLDADTVRGVAREVLGPALAAGPVCVLSSREKLEAANAQLDPGLVISEL